MPKRARKKQGANVRKERRLALCPSKHQRTGASCTTEEKIAGKGWINRKLVLLVTSGTSNTLSTSTIISTTSSSPTTTATIATAPAGAILPLLLLCYLLRKWKPARGTPRPRTFTAWARWLRSFGHCPLVGVRGPGPPPRRAPQR